MLNKKFGNNKLSHDDYIEYISNYLIDSTLVDRFSLFQQRTIWTNTNKQRFVKQHFVQKIPKDHTKKRDPNPICKACNFTSSQMVHLGFEPRQLPWKTTTYWCLSCEIPLCITLCFEIYHTIDEYHAHLLLNHLPDH